MGVSAGDIFKRATYGSIEGGLGYKLETVPFLFSVGYKYQVINTKIDDPSFRGKDTHALDITRGAILAITYLF